MLYKIGIADGTLNQWEEHYIYKIAERLNIPVGELNSIIKDPDRHIETLPETYAQRLEFFYNLLFMMGIDNKVTPEEKELCKKIGFKLCFNPMLMDDLINIIIENLGKNVPVNDIINAVIKYQN